ncbi:MAG: class I SAM-dependent DNA methyltransferase, partial [Anaerolineae bacterium]|nr:class I SAM-dependent DNA methyltransferase [Anaerolineae bacterium]
MPTSSTQRVYELLNEMQRTTGLNPLKRLFWTELNYDRADQPLSTRGWPDAAGQALADDPVLFATAGGEMGDFSVIYCQLNGNLLIGPQRPVIRQLLDEFPHALYIFSDEAQRYWHFVNVKYDKEARSRRLFRRITVGPYERLRTASERIAMLEPATVSHDLFGISPLAIQQRHDEAFDVEAVTRTFFQTYREVFEAAESAVQGIDDSERCRLFTQRLFNRLMFIVFLERKGWLDFNGDYEYLAALWADHQHVTATGADENFYRDRLKLLFFSGLNTRHDVNIIGITRKGPLQARIGSMPYLNGGLFEEDEDDRNPDIWVPDEVIKRAIDDLFYHYNFTIT